uniref:Uncharacterized protein n=1 Tax=Glossina austeni TaxID=7395 RepID=A0A1A9UTG1_GLOAU
MHFRNSTIISLLIIASPNVIEHVNVKMLLYMLYKRNNGKANTTPTLSRRTMYKRCAGTHDATDADQSAMKNEKNIFVFVFVFVALYDSTYSILVLRQRYTLYAKIFTFLTKAKKTLSSNIEDLCHQPQRAFITMVVLIAE